MNNKPLVLCYCLVIFVVTYSSGGPLCGSNNMMCFDLHNFRECINDQDYALGLVTACPEGEICDNFDGRVVCRSDHSPTTTTELPVTPPSCFDSGKYPAEICYEYYECVAVLWWWQPELKSCPEGQAFDAKLDGCTIAAWFNCQSATTTTVPKTTTTVPTTTTTVPTTTTAIPTTTTAVPTTTTTTTAEKNPTTPVTVPACFDSSKYPAKTCYDYYECVAVWWWWQPELKSCPEGQAFDAKLDRCTIGAWFNCQPATTTIVPTTTTTVPKTTTTVPTTTTIPTTTTTTPTTTTAIPISTTVRTTMTEKVPTTTHVSPVTVPVCFDSSKYPAETCYEYYECVAVWWWWQPELESCPEGQAFDAKLDRCTIGAWFNCQSATTTTVPTTTITVPINTTTVPTTTTTVPTTTRTVPTTTTILETTTKTTAKIRTTAYVPPVTAPPCFDSRKYPTAICYEYYECVAVWWWWQPELKNCSDGQAFDEKLEECTAAAWFNCQPSIKTTVPTTTTTVPTTTTTVPTITTTVLTTTTRVSTTTAILPTISTNPVTEPLCFGPSKYPAPQCDQYYECVQFLWWWQPELKNCPSEQAFNSSTNNCMIADLTNCIPKPACYGSSKHPAPSPNQYYECVPFLWWWQPTLKACPEGQNFVSSVAQCVDQNLENTFSRFLPKCTAPGKYQAPRQGQYYECEFVSSEWLLKLKACPNSELEIFDPDLQMCREDSQTK